MGVGEEVLVGVAVTVLVTVGDALAEGVGDAVVAPGLEVVEELDEPEQAASANAWTTTATTVVVRINRVISPVYVGAPPEAPRAEQSATPGVPGVMVEP